MCSGTYVPEQSNTCAICITHHPGADLCERLRVIAPQVHTVLLVDNGSNDNEKAAIRPRSPRHSTHMIENEQNNGCARALNQGIEWAKDHGYYWTVLIDQDSDPFGHMVQVLADVYRCANSSRRVGAIGSNYLDKATGEPALGPSYFGLSNWADSKVVISSGTLLSLQAADAVGAFRDDYFVDLVDLEYCLRMRRAGYDVLVTREPLMEHTPGNPTPTRFLWKRLILRGEPPIRYYHMVRNVIALARQYHRTERSVAWELLAWSARESVKILLAGKEKPAYAAAICRGLVDGIAGRMGR